MKAKNKSQLEEIMFNLKPVCLKLKSITEAELLILTFCGEDNYLKLKQHGLKILKSYGIEFTQTYTDDINGIKQKIDDIAKAQIQVIALIDEFKAELINSK